MATSHPLESALALAWPPPTWQDVTVILAVSGGADSVALTRALSGLGRGGQGRLLLAHFHHGVRREAGEDEQFVRQLAKRLDLPLHVGRASRQIPAENGSSEAGWRAARYAFLKDCAKQWGARYVATGHTADDQAETTLHRVLRGSSVAGLAGIPRVRRLLPGVALIRPLLSVRRRDVLAYLSSLGQAWRVDASNQDPRFTRNRIRGELLPLLEQVYNPQIVEALLRLSQMAEQTQQIVDQQADLLLERVALRNGDQIHVDTTQLPSQPHLIREMFVHIWKERDWPLRDMSFAKWSELAGLSQSPRSAVRTLPGGVRAEKRGGSLWLSRPA